MGLGDFIEDAEKAATGQGGQDGDNNANNASGSNDKTADTMVDSGELCFLVYIAADIFPNMSAYSPSLELISIIS
jgi:hypothetical protein